MAFGIKKLTEYQKTTYTKSLQEFSYQFTLIQKQAVNMLGRTVTTVYLQGMERTENKFAINQQGNDLIIVAVHNKDNHKNSKESVKQVVRVHYFGKELYRSLR
jgi:hypothetical protein